MIFVLGKHVKTSLYNKKVCLHKSPGRQEWRAKNAEEACATPRVHTHIQEVVPGSLLKAHRSGLPLPVLRWRVFPLQTVNHHQTTLCVGLSNSSPLRRFHGDWFFSITLKSAPSPAATGGSALKGEAPSLPGPRSASMEADPGSCPADVCPAWGWGPAEVAPEGWNWRGSGSIWR